MPLPKNADLGLVVNLLEERGVHVTRTIKRLLKHFKVYDVVVHIPNGYDSSDVDVYQHIAEKTGMKRDIVFTDFLKLQECGILGTQGGTRSLGATSTDYGFTPQVERLYH